MNAPLPPRAGIARLLGAVLWHRRLLAALCAAVTVLAVVRVVEPPPPAVDPVVVAARDLPAGTVLGPEHLRTVDYASGTAPDGLLTRPAGRSLAGPVRRGEPLTSTRVVQPGLLAEHPGLAAVPVRIPDPTTVSLLRVGDRVDLVAADPAAGHATPVATEALVLALPAEPERLSGGTTGRLVLFGVSDHEVGAVGAAAVRDFVTPVWRDDDR